jgi:hypothetical protein
MSLDAAFFISKTIHERKVKLPDGSEHVLYFRELSAVDFVRYREDQSSESAEVRALATPKMIALSLCEPDGKPAMSQEKAATLKPAAMRALFEAVLEVNTFDAKKPLPSEAASGSATSSASPSEKPSPRSTRSRK